MNSDPKTANHHWFPFLRYIEECEASGRDVSINDWLKLTGKLKGQEAHQLARKNAKAEAAAKAAAAAATATSE